MCGITFRNEFAIEILMCSQKALQSRDAAALAAAEALQEASAAESVLQNLRQVKRATC